ncbi:MULTISPECIES: 2-oxoacid:acceptor oxidoreductase subunit alpha [Streptomyces]|uniref:2-oxoacid:acceptor oxidoreductase subunit alpha n=3 Tax=Streptomyces rimosus TaxID=1927 RepID=L8ERX3_STRR1|nr:MULTISPECIES: 2-oxoacid:acceptor oxidoreductase subunit alpha [Streptomyces]KOG68330.1 2-oxoglutarate ferredoxin oxidoreductase subunit alpha [Kitasatospora aureofaciens]MYT44498.1 2-oxoacid:acceptor oxidoreductase subunit alpha [Streptomyces sp. SID5471]KEF02547.1 2-oxoglutarate ferredoxin oxidoreductase subunit alpha [Streptomyces rimosus]KEF18646.1 2-oxoglutarate ferredoxin oxidoreductase subunit alpha [Streptomyces rimosus]KUJ26427.1 2-oxoglutarate ferredoxin oxidoreductase subunit alph
MTSQVSSQAEQADGALTGEPQAPGTGAGADGGKNGGKEVRRLDRVIIRFAGDSGDGMQLTGDRFTSETATFGNDLSTLPNFPAEIRAPAGTLPGVSSFQLHFADHDILTPGDAPNVLVAMNPAALKANLGDVPRGAEIIVNTDEFTKRPMAKVGYEVSPLEDGTLSAYNVHPVPLTTLTIEALKDFGLSRKEAERSKNMFALGLLSWMYHRPTEGTEAFLRQKFAKKPDIAEANVAAFRAGWNFGETTEDFAVSYEVAPATQAFPTGTYRNISGNLALSYGLIAAGQQADLPLYLGSYPITPASDILHELSKHKNFGVRTFQAEDEIAGIGAALGAAFGGALAVTTTSGPGVALKSETIGLAVSLELPLVIVDIQRGGPSTGLPTKTEQADLLQAMYGRNGEAPVPIVAPRTPADCFDAALDAARIALTYRTPVFLLSDGYLANGSEPWRIPELDQLPDLRVQFANDTNHTLADGTEVFWPYKRDEQTLARPWAVPGTPGLEHRIGGIEKQDGTGNISYDPANHDFMVRTRQAKIDGIEVPDLEVDDPTAEAAVRDGQGAAAVRGADTLVLGWGSTYGPITAAVRRVRRDGGRIAQAHLRHLNPFPRNLGAVLARYDKVVVPEMNLGQLATLLRAKYLVDARSYTQVSGMPFKAEQLAEVFKEAIND